MSEFCARYNSDAVLIHTQSYSISEHGCTT